MNKRWRTRWFGALMIGAITVNGSAQDRRVRPIPTTASSPELSPYIGHTHPKIRRVQAEQPLAPAPLQSGNSALGGNRPGSSALFGDNTGTRSLLGETRSLTQSAPSEEMVYGSSAGFRATSDAGNLLSKSIDAPGTTGQKRTPIVTDARVRGSQSGQLLASGSYWVPARIDLDTQLSKLDSRMIETLRIIKGPYDVIYGPGFNFVDVALTPSPRFGRETEIHSQSIAEYKHNGDQLYGREVLLGGDDRWGFRVGYGHRTGNDYEDGSGNLLPSSYKSRDVDAALGFDLSENANLEIHYLRLDQTDVEFPGQAFDLDFLKTDGAEAVLTVTDQPWFDGLVFETWYNQTIFKGNAQNPGKRTQIPELDLLQLFARTEVYSRSSGFQLMGIWGDADGSQLRTGVDFRFLRQELNEPDGRAVLPFFPNPIVLVDQNGVVPRSHWSNPGVFADFSQQWTDRLTVTVGGRLDYATTDVDNEVQGSFGNLRLDNQTLLQLLGANEFETEFVLPAGHVTAAYELDDVWTVTAQAGTAGRTPNLTELYAFGPFLAILQQGFSSGVGDPNLDPERLYQADLRLDAQTGRLRAGVSGFHAWIKDYITYEAIGQNALVNSLTVRWVNTDWAVLTGGEAFVEYDASDFVTLYGQVQYVEGRDLTRSDGGARSLGTIRDENLPRGAFSRIPGGDKEPLPGIPPLQSRLGIVLHDSCPVPHWTFEFSARIVDNQDRVATSLRERPTPGFTTFDVRTSWRPWEHVTILAGVENLTDKFYREHLDVRTGRGVFQPGINAYVGTEVLY